ncbi:Snf7 family protein [Candidatus Bathyarchaeota archaeon A05DMB-3]|nr:Snf7 family protein [Candidatus Bathyarchaeota archaeon A05DMB-3]
MVQASLRLKERDKRLFQTCVTALKANNKERAAICANELAEVRKLISFLQQVELAIERVILRLETMKELSDIVIDLKPALKTLQSVSKQLFEIMPEVSSEISEINDVIGETIYSTRMSAENVVIPVDRVTPAGEQILDEVSSFLEKRLAEKLPEPPATQEAPKVKQAETHIKQMVALAAACSQTVGGETVEEKENRSENLISFRKAEIQEISLKVGKPSLEEALLEYVRKSGGEIDLMRCSRELGASYEEVEKALQNLGAKGKIKIEARR